MKENLYQETLEDLAAMYEVSKLDETNLKLNNPDCTENLFTEGELVWSRLTLDKSYDEKVKKYSVFKLHKEIDWSEIIENVSKFAKQFDIIDFEKPAYLGQSRVLSIDKGHFDNYIVTIYDGENKI